MLDPDPQHWFQVYDIGIPQRIPFGHTASGFLSVKNGSSSVGDPWHFGADTDLHLLLMDPDPTQDPTPLFSDFKDAKKICSHFFPITYPQAQYL